ncbi:MAG TPA: glycosyltransferase family 2 protein [Gemmatimonadaceae bacterium]|nr:glycosyltransferase family 2 protein [Gemmatimonadaceae bacterium]
MTSVPARPDRALEADGPDAVAGGRWPFSVSVVIAALNEAPTIGGVVGRILAVCPDAEILVIDDCSRDDTAALAEAAGARVIRRPYTLGQGAGVKTGVRTATGDVVVLIDGDGQHDPADIPRLLDLIGPYDLVIGKRDRAGQQNTVRWLGNGLLNRLGTYLVGVEMHDLTSGFRVMRRHVMRDLLHLLPNQFSWSTTSALAFAKAGFHVRFEPIVVRRRETGQSSQKLMRNGIRFLLIVLRMSTLFSPLRIFFPLFVIVEGLSLVGYLWSVAAGAPVLHLPPSTVMFFLGGLVLLFFGLISEQIASLRFRSPESWLTVGPSRE